MMLHDINLVVTPYDAPGRYSVMSESQTGSYLVDLTAYGGKGQCACTDWKVRIGYPRAHGRTPEKERCKHIEAARLYLVANSLDLDGIADKLIAAIRADQCERERSGDVGA